MDSQQSTNDIHPEDALHMERENRKLRIETVEKEMRGAYWKLINEKIQSWIIAADKRRLNLLDTGITEKTMRLLNEEKIKMDILAQVLKINEAIIYENKTWLDKFKEKVSMVKSYVQTFVGYGREKDEI